MDKKDVKKILSVLIQADGGCITCASSLIESFIEKFELNREEVKILLSEVLKEEGSMWELDDYFDEDDEA